MEYPFENACFVSYRSGQEPLTKDFIEDLEAGLKAEVESLVGRPVYVDKSRLEGGDFFNEELARALCQSACLVLVYTPTYFSSEHPYPAREYQAMCNLEVERFKVMTNRAPNKGLVIPVIFRGGKDLPEEIKHRQHCDLEGMVLVERRLSSHDDFGQRMKETGEYIHERCKELAMAPEAFSDCDDFELPSIEAIKPLLERVSATRAPFPAAKVGDR